MADSLRREIDTKLETTSAYLQKYNYQAYPGKQVVESAAANLRELKQIRDTKELFETLNTKQADLRSVFDGLKPVSSFFEHQVAIFDRATKAVQDYDFVSSSITVSSPEVAAIREILTNDSPYGDIPKLSQLTSAVEQAVKDGRTQLDERANEARKLDEERRRAEVERSRAEAEGREVAEVPRVAKPVRSGDLIRRSYDIKSEADIDTMLAELKQRLLQELADNGEVKVI